jgi:hypothetical protein
MSVRECGTEMERIAQLRLILHREGISNCIKEVKDLPSESQILWFFKVTV